MQAAYNISHPPQARYIDVANASDASANVDDDDGDIDDDSDVDDEDGQDLALLSLSGPVRTHG